MQFSYLALFWNSGNPAQQTLAEHLLQKIRRSRVDWKMRVSAMGAAVFDTQQAPHPMGTYTLPAGRGLVFGRLFDRSTSAALSPDPLTLGTEFRTLTPKAVGSYLVRRFWGAYVAFAIDPETGSWMALRDPSGMVPCYFATICGLSLFFTDIRHLLELHDFLQINWKYIIAFLSWPHLQIRETALTDVQELLAGEIVTGSAESRNTDFGWNPASVCLSSPLLDEEAATSELLRATECSIGAWASLHRTLLHSLSGGFDSALVLGAMLKCPQPPNIVCVNRYGTAPGEDERRFARSASGQHGVRLLEFPWDVSIPALNETLLATPLAPKPTVPHVLGALDAPFWNDLCHRYCCDGITTGQGGDHLFLSARTALGVADSLSLYGVGKEFREALRDAAFLTGKSYLHILASTASVFLNRKSFLRHAQYTPKTGMLSEDAIFAGLPHYILPPWCAASRHLPAGKRYQLLQLADVLNRQRPMPDVRVIDELHPLLAQPLLEVALRVPVHLLQTGGRPRGLARDTFRHLVPATIASRELKGHTSSYILGLIKSSLPFLRQLLLEGTLVRRGILNPTVLSRHLDAAEPVRSQVIFPLLAGIAAELWIRRWDARAHNPPLEFYPQPERAAVPLTATEGTS